MSPTSARPAANRLLASGSACPIPLPSPSLRTSSSSSLGGHSVVPSDGELRCAAAREAAAACRAARDRHLMPTVATDSPRRWRRHSPSARTMVAAGCAASTSCGTAAAAARAATTTSRSSGVTRCAATTTTRRRRRRQGRRRTRPWRRWPRPTRRAPRRKRWRTKSAIRIARRSTTRARSTSATTARSGGSPSLPVTSTREGAPSS